MIFKKYTFVFLLLLGISHLLHGAQDIEIKMQLSPEQLASLKTLLENAVNQKNETLPISQVNTITETDYYLDNPKQSFYFSSEQGFTDALGTLRVRCNPEGDYVCYKFRHLDPETKKTLYRDEYNIKIENGTEMLKLLTCLGYTDQMIIKKNRTAYFSGNFIISIDEVENLGTFVEIYLKKPEKTIRKSLHLIVEMVKQLGITTWKQIDRSYVHILLNPGHDFGEQIKMSQIKI